MKAILVILGGILLLVVGIIVYVVGQYNSMVVAEENVSQAQAQVEVVLQRRFDLIPNLVESVKGSMTQEQTVFGDIAEARTRYANAEAGSAEKMEAANQLESSLGRLLVIVENYPELRSNETVISLMDELAGSENRVAVERKRYNEAVTRYNKLIRVMPNSFFANIFGFDSKVLFESTEGADVPPEVDLNISL